VEVEVVAKNPLSPFQGTDVLGAQLAHQTVLERLPEPLDAPFGLR
jgi:hypothetical protein